MGGVIFVLVYLLAPQRGLIAIARRRARQKLEFAETMLVIHLFNHENLPEAATERKVDHLNYHLKWDFDFAGLIVKRSLQKRFINRIGDELYLTDDGRDKAKKMIEI